MCVCVLELVQAALLVTRYRDLPCVRVAQCLGQGLHEVGEMFVTSQ